MVKEIQKPVHVANEIKILFSADTYEWRLGEDLKKIAKKDLREDEKSREQGLATMRDWISKCGYIKNCRLDSNFLLRFLRVKKFSVPSAFDTLTKYIGMRQNHVSWFHNTTINDPMVADLISRGVSFALPERDKFGRRVMFTIGANIDPSYHTSEAVLKAIMLTAEALLEDEENQIRGFSHILDESGITMKHMTLWNPSEIAKIFVTCEKSLPMRHKSLDFVSLPTFLHFVYEVATKTFMSAKLRSRIRLHRNAKCMAETIDPRILPLEYGGTIPLATMTELFKQELISKNMCAKLAVMDKMQVDFELMKKLGNDKGMPGTTMTTFSKELLGVGGSFKKLEFD